MQVIACDARDCENTSKTENVVKVTVTIGDGVPHVADLCQSCIDGLMQMMPCVELSND